MHGDKQPSPRRVGAWSGAGVVCLLLLLGYMPAILGGYVWDDDAYVTENTCLKNLDGLRRIWTEIGATPQYYPLVHSTFWAEHHIWGLHPLGYHLTNLLLHALTALVLWRILRRLALPGAGLAAALFALHPVHVESVAWITERKNVLSGLFYMLALLSYLRFTPLPLGGGAGQSADVPRGRRWAFYVLSLFLFAGALLSKTVTCTLPAVIVLVLWWRRSWVGLRDWLAVTPMFAIGAGMGLLTAWMEKRVVGADGVEWSFTFLDRCLIAGRALWFYAAKLVWPTSLTFIYPRWTIDAGQAWQYAYPAAAFLVIAALWLLRRRIGRGPLVAVLIFVGTLTPALGFFDVYPMRYSFVADHFQYLASVSLIVLMAVTATRIVRFLARHGSRTVVLPAAYVGTIGLLCLLAFLVERQASIYRDIETLWRDTIAKNPDCIMARSNLACVLLERGNAEEAMAHLRHALSLRPEDVDLRCNLGRAFERQGRLEAALVSFRRALEGRPNDPRFRRNVGVTLAKLGRPEEAIDQLSMAVRLRPDDVASRQNLAELLQATGHTDRAIRHYEVVVRAQPGKIGPMNNLAWLLATQPYATVSEGERAVELAKQTCRRTDFQIPMLLDTLGAAYAAAGRYAEATTAAERARRLAEELEQDALADRIRTRLALYRSERRFTHANQGS